LPYPGNTDAKWHFPKENATFQYSQKELVNSGTAQIYLIQLTSRNRHFVATGEYASEVMRISFPIRIFGELPAGEWRGQLNPGSFTISK
jgi:hypothetical protein